jgi:3-deoxy-D-manno-octulosonate 8-phosphate phosphatase (KDO 8-P phosphatase)
MVTNNQKTLNLAKSIKLLLIDVDGVLSDGKLYFANSGEELKSFNIKDGLGIKLLQRNGIEVGIITGRSSKIVSKRAKDLGINIIIQGREDKLAALNEILEDDKKNINYLMQEIAFLGDDLPDVSIIRQVGLGVAVGDAHEFVVKNSNWQTMSNGGCGAVRELAELILGAQNKLDLSLIDFL